MKKLLTLIGAASFAAMSANAAVIVDDSWADGDLASTGLSDASWYATTTSSAIEVSTGSMGLVSGSSGRGIHGTFASSSLAVGETLTASFTFTTPTTVGAKKEAFRIFLGNSNGTDMDQNFSFSSSSPEPLVDNPIGYYVDFGVNAGADNYVGMREGLSPRTTGRFISTSTGWDSLDKSAVDTYAFAANTEYTGIFSITVNESDITLYSSMSDSSGEMISFSTLANTGVSDFDMIAFQVGSSTFGSNKNVGDLDNGIDFSNITISAVPEPSTYAAIFGAIALGFAIRRKKRA